MKKGLLFLLSVILLLGISLAFSSCDVNLDLNLLGKTEELTDDTAQDTAEDLGGDDAEEGEFVLIGEEIFYTVNGVAVENTTVNGYTIGKNGRLEQSGFVKLGENTYYLSNTYCVYFNQHVI